MMIQLVDHPAKKGGPLFRIQIAEQSSRFVFANEQELRALAFEILDALETKTP